LQRRRTRGKKVERIRTVAFVEPVDDDEVQKTGNIQKRKSGAIDEADEDEVHDLRVSDFDQELGTCVEGLVRCLVLFLGVLQICGASSVTASDAPLDKSEDEVHDRQGEHVDEHSDDLEVKERKSRLRWSYRR
jgi:hypothetical protein